MQATKQGWLYTFNRLTGEPVWPIEERAVQHLSCREVLSLRSRM